VFVNSVGDFLIQELKSLDFLILFYTLETDLIKCLQYKIKCYSSVTQSIWDMCVRVCVCVCACACARVRASGVNLMSILCHAHNIHIMGLFSK